MVHCKLRDNIILSFYLKSLKFKFAFILREMYCIQQSPDYEKKDPISFFFFMYAMRFCIMGITIIKYSIAKACNSRFTDEA